MSNTEGLAQISMEIMRRNKVGVELVRMTDFELPPGVYPDMTEHGWERDDWRSIGSTTDASGVAS